MQNSPKVYYIKLEFGENFLTKKVHFQKNGFFKKVIFLNPFFQSISIITYFSQRKFCFSPYSVGVEGGRLQ